MIAQFFFIIFSLIALMSAISMLFLRHPMRVALALITTMLSLACLYATMGNHVLALFQVLIYVGAIMVFMVYVIMLLNTKDSSYLKRFSRYAIVAGPLLILAIFLFVPKLAISPISYLSSPATFSLASFSLSFITEYFLFFELSSVVLLVAVVCAISVIKGRKHV